MDSVWTRNSSSNLWGWLNNGVILPEDSLIIDSYNNNSATLTGYTFYIDSTWVPLNPYDTAKLAYTVYSHDSLLNEINEFEKDSKRIWVGSPFPNPSNKNTDLSYFLPIEEYIVLSLFDITGRKIRTLYEGKQNRGINKVRIDCLSLSNGIYIIQLSTKSDKEQTKLLIVR